MSDVEVVNIVASVPLGTEVDLDKISLENAEADYDKERFPGLIFRLKDPKTAVLLFRSGKLVCTGGKSINDVQKAIDIVIKRIEKSGIPVEGEPEITIQNIVATGDLGTKVNLTTITLSLGYERVEYEPEQFPGLVYRMDEPKAVLLLFGSGKIVCTGAKKVDDANLAVDNLRNELASAGLLS